MNQELEFAKTLEEVRRLSASQGNVISKEQIEEIVLKDENVATALNGATVKKVIVIPGRLVNIIA